MRRLHLNSRCVKKSTLFPLLFPQFLDHTQILSVDLIRAHRFTALNHANNPHFDPIRMNVAAPWPIGICCLLLALSTLSVGLGFGASIERAMSLNPVPGGFMVDLQMRQGHMRKHGRILQRRSGSLDIEGSVRDMG